MREDEGGCNPQHHLKENKYEERAIKPVYLSRPLHPQGEACW